MFRNILLSLLFAATLFVSAVLLFLVQPLVGRLMLPLLGGTPAVWNTCMVFFQAVLLAGYAYAHATPKWLGARPQRFLHLLLLPLPFLALPLALPGSVNPSAAVPVLWLLGLLVLVAGLPFFVVSTSAPLLQRWFTETGHPAARDPYFLYAASNLGSFLALAAYPLVVEPLLALGEQSRAWTAGYGVLMILILCCAFVLWRSAPALATLPSGKELPPAWSQRLRWVLLAFVPSSLMLSVTMYITTDIAAIPLLWVGPLALYLLTFVIAFARRPWLPHRFVVRWTPLAVLIVILLLLSEATDTVLWLGGGWLLVGLHLFGLFWIALMCHGELARTRPASRDLTEFYLWLSLGGVLGGLFNVLVAPLLFNSILEYRLVLVLACYLRPASLDPKKAQPPFRWTDLLWPLGVGVLTAALILGLQSDQFNLGRLNAGAMFAVPLLLVYALQERPLRYALSLGALLLASGLFYPGVYGHALYQKRTFFGVHRVTLDSTGQFRILVHGNTIHGRQSLDPAHAREPLTYYHRQGPAGRVFAALHGEERLKSGAAITGSAGLAMARMPVDPRLDRVGVIGLGAGSLCAYAEPGQRWTYYEIDPEVEYIARHYFTFIDDCAVKPAIVIGDARLTLARSNEKYGLLVVDAFSSDAIPVHLVTREALAVYRRHLDDDGVLLFHISNRYLDLETVLGKLAGDADMLCLSQNDVHRDAATGKEPSHWVLMGTPAALAKFYHRGLWGKAEIRFRGGVWRDDYSNLLGAVRVETNE